MHDIDQMTSKATNIAIALLCELQAHKESESDVECTSDAITVEDGYRGKASLRFFQRREERLLHTRKADYKRLLTACTKLIINEA